MEHNVHATLDDSAAAVRSHPLAMRQLIAGAWLVVALLMSRTACAEVHVVLANGKVTLSATNATVSEILAEWARVGQTRIVNAERVTGAPLSLELTDVPESEALDILLRRVSGYLAALRPAAVENVSVYDRIVLLPADGATPTRPTLMATTSSGVLSPPSPVPEDDSNRTDVGARVGVESSEPQPGVQQHNVPMPGTGADMPFAQPSNALQQAPRPTAAPVGSRVPPISGAPSVPIGVSTPGMLATTPPPEQPQTEQPQPEQQLQEQQPGTRAGTRP